MVCLGQTQIIVSFNIFDKFDDLCEPIKMRQPNFFTNGLSISKTDFENLSINKVLICNTSKNEYVRPLPLKKL